MQEAFGSRQDLFSQESIQYAVQDTFPIANYQLFAFVWFYHTLENNH